MEPATRMPTKAKNGKFCWSLRRSAISRCTGASFSSGNHPVEMFLPVLHLDAAGFEIDIATISGDPVKFETWAFPKMTRQWKKYLRNISKSCVALWICKRYGEMASIRIHLTLLYSSRISLLTDRSQHSSMGWQQQLNTMIQCTWRYWLPSMLR